jgi:pyridoxal phosphate enzyme (YggS family)
MKDLKENLQNVRSRVETACVQAGRDADEVLILAVSKRQETSKIRGLNQLGLRSFGENFVQEALAKQKELSELALEWHFIGPLQSNKTRAVATHFHWVQSVDRAKLLRRLSAQRPESLPGLNVCLQVNIDRERSKSGVFPEELPELAQFAATLPHLKLRGLMAIPEAATATHDPSGSFRRMRELFEALRASGIELDTLSMGMSGDLEQAIAQGSTMVRIGTDLFGARPTGAEA